MMTYELKNVAILNAEGVDYRCILWSIGKNDAINRLNNSVLEDKSVLQIDLDANKTPVKVIKEGALGGTYLRDIYSGVNEKRYKKSWKKFDELKDIDQKYYCLDYYDVIINKYGAKCRASLRTV